ncbi:hypothetical protein AMK06_CH01059 [Rhizobium sp. N541]|nr:hypothetical protein AMK06_CH01059 [Rhizobium sp. N541]
MGACRQEARTEGGASAFLFGDRCFAAEATPPSVLLGLDPRIHAASTSARPWIPGSRPGMTEIEGTSGQEARSGSGRTARRRTGRRRLPLSYPATPRYLAAEVTPPSVLLGLDPRIHAASASARPWIPGSRPGMTEIEGTSGQEAQTGSGQTARRQTGRGAGRQGSESQEAPTAFVCGHPSLSCRRGHPILRPPRA